MDKKDTYNPFGAMLGRCILFGKSPAVFVRPGTGGANSKVYKKELIRVGEYYRAGSDLSFAVTQEVLQHWVNMFGRLTVNGVQVPIPPSHYDLDNNHGYVREMFIEDESLYGMIELFGEDEEIEKLVATQDVSIYSPDEFIDGDKNVYIYPITHVALTPFPVVPGLREFEAIAASLTPSKETHTMDWNTIREKLGIETEMTDENAQDLILSGKKPTSS
jgi:hypothetical protein